MENKVNFGEMQFNLPKNQSNVIKVIGVGGGGSNAVNHMYNLGSEGVDFVICNTDAQALNSSSVPIKIQLGATLTEGLGAGGDPEIGKQSAVESREAIENMLGEKAKMVFITVGMGGGTGTGAAPIIAEIAKSKGLLTVAIVTTPFNFEGKIKMAQAKDGIEAMSEFVDSIIVINNNKLREVYGNLGITSGYSKVDEVLSTAAMGISKVITKHYTQNIDFKDAQTVLANSGTAIMGSAKAEGLNRAQEAITKALDSPLLNDNKIKGAENVLLLIVFGDKEISIDEMGEINDFVQSEAKTNVNIFMGVGEEEGLGDFIEVTIIATGFNKEQQEQISTIENEKIVYKLEDSETGGLDSQIATKNGTTEQPKIVHKLEEDIVKEIIVDKEDIEAPIENELVEEPPLTLFDLNIQDTSSRIIRETPKEEILVEPEIESINKIDVIDETPIKEETKDVNNTVQGFLGNDFFDLFSEVKKDFNPKEEGSLEEISSIRIELPTNEPVEINTSEPLEEVIEKKIIEESEVIEETNFIITPVISDIEVFDVVEIKPIEDEQLPFAFDMPIKSEASTNDISFKETNNTDKVKKHSLEEYMELEETLSNAKAEDNSINSEVNRELELKLESKTVENSLSIEEEDINDSNVSPMNATIKELTKRSNSRRNTMNRYNHQFSEKTLQTIEELEKEPAYKRSNIKLEDNPTSNDITRTSIEVNKGDVSFRSNNSFLHDNVD